MWDIYRKSIGEYGRGGKSSHMEKEVYILKNPKDYCFEYSYVNVLRKRRNVREIEQKRKKVGTEGYLRFIGVGS